MAKSIVPRWVQWTVAGLFLAVPLTATVISLYANVAYTFQFGLAAMAAAAMSDIARFCLPIIAVILMGWNWGLRLALLLVSIFSAWTAINFAADTRLQDFWNRTEHAVVYDDNKAEIARLARDLSQITEVGAPNALKGQIDVLETRLTQLNTEIDYESDPQKNGPCRSSCEQLKEQRNAAQSELLGLQERYGQAAKRVQLEKAINSAREKRDVSAPVEKSGLAQLSNHFFNASERNIDISAQLVNVLLYLLLVEGLSHLMTLAMSTTMRLAETRPEPVVEVTEEPVAPEIPYVLDIGPLQVAVPAEPVVAAEPVQDESAKVEAKAPRKRRKDGRFAKRPGPKPKLKMNELPRPEGENVVVLKDFKKD